ncbi:MAG: 3-isopropylmalate dehydratase small subunit [Armatimonadetes bacterium]|nr:3-isopropylmalate dehydratase small subunit [Armatimonadota bacterium]
MRIITGRAHKFGDHIDTDVIIPARYLVTTDPVELGRHCMEPVASDFPSRVSPGDIIVAGRNFGCGSSREHAPLAIKGCGIACVVAASFARIFYRNALNVGLPIVECPEAAREISEGEIVEINLDEGVARSLESGREWRFAPLAGIARELLDAGGLVPLVRRRLAERR